MSAKVASVDADVDVTAQPAIVKKDIQTVDNDDIKKNTATAVDNDDNKDPLDKGISIQAFRGYHPPANLMSDVASPPYDVIDTEEARLACKNNPKSFLNVNKPEIQFKPGFDQYSDAVYQMGATQIDKFCTEKWLIQDDKPCLYIYSQKMNDHEQFGLVAESSAIQYENGLIKKHELTRKKKEDDRTRLTDIQSANVGPIFLCYKQNNEIDAKINKYVADNTAFADWVSDDQIQHKLWIIDDATLINDITTLFQTQIDYTYVADGHHRTAAAWRVYKKRKADLIKKNKYTGNEPFHYFLSVLFPANQLKILDYNRIISGGFANKNYSNNNEFLDVLTKNGWTYSKIVMDADDFKDDDKNKVPVPVKSNDFRMYLKGDGWYKLSISDDIVAKHADDVVKCLDVSILSDYLLDPALGITDLRSDPKIGFLGGIHGLDALKKKVDAAGSGVAFGLYPTTVPQLMNVADANKLMPPKSTWFEPKLRSGVVVRRF